MKSYARYSTVPIRVHRYAVEFDSILFVNVDIRAEYRSEDKTKSTQPVMIEFHKKRESFKMP